MDEFWKNGTLTKAFRNEYYQKVMENEKCIIKLDHSFNTIYLCDQMMVILARYIKNKFLTNEELISLITHYPINDIPYKKDDDLYYSYIFYHILFNNNDKYLAQLLELVKKHLLTLYRTEFIEPFDYFIKGYSFLDKDIELSINNKCIEIIDKKFVIPTIITNNKELLNDSNFVTNLLDDENSFEYKFFNVYVDIKQYLSHIATYKYDSIIISFNNYLTNPVFYNHSFLNKLYHVFNDNIHLGLLKAIRTVDLYALQYSSYKKSYTLYQNLLKYIIVKNTDFDNYPIHNMELKHFLSFESLSKISSINALSKTNERFVLGFKEKNYFYIPYEYNQYITYLNKLIKQYRQISISKDMLLELLFNGNATSMYAFISRLSFALCLNKNELKYFVKTIYNMTIFVSKDEQLSLLVRDNNEPLYVQYTLYRTIEHYLNSDYKTFSLYMNNVLNKDATPYKELFFSHSVTYFDQQQYYLYKDYKIYNYNLYSLLSLMITISKSNGHYSKSLFDIPSFNEMKRIIFNQYMERAKSNNKDEVIDDYLDLSLGNNEKIKNNANPNNSLRINRVWVIYCLERFYSLYNHDYNTYPKLRNQLSNIFQFYPQFSIMKNTNEILGLIEYINKHLSKLGCLSLGKCWSDIVFMKTRGIEHDRY